MGRHHRPDTTESLGRPQLVMTVRGTNPPSRTTPSRTTPSTPPPAPGVLGPTPVVAPAPVIEPAGPPAHVGWRGRRSARRQQVETEALAARIARAQRRLRQVSVPADALPAIPTPRPAGDAAPPWRTEFPAPGETSA